MKKTILFSVLMLVIMGIQIQQAQAVSALSTSALNIYPIVNEKQVGKATNFFNINTEEDTTEKLKFQAVNTSNKDINLDVMKGNALSVTNGGVHLSPETKTDSSYFLNNKFEIKNWIAINDKVTIPAKSKMEIPVEVKIPKNVEEGTYIGGVIFQQKSKGTPSNIGTKGEATLQINNNFNYEFAIQLNVGKVNEDYDSSKLKIKNVKIDELKNELTFIGENYHNYLLNLTNLTYVVKDDNDEEVYKGKLPILKFSPMTSGTYKFQLGDVKFKKGDYKLIIKDNSQNEINDGSFKLKDNVTMKKEDIGKRVIIKEKENNENIYLVVGIALVCCAVSIVVGIILGKRTKKNDKE